MRRLELNKRLTFFLLAFLLLFTSRVFADGPTTLIKSAVDQVIGVLKDPSLRGEAKKKERRSLLRQIILPDFDFREMAKRSLGSHWGQHTPEEQGEFVRLFTDLLEKAYLGRIETYNNEKFVYTREKIEQNYAEVYSEVTTGKGEKFRIDYRLHRLGNDWKIYDVIVEDISLVNNYRSQFNRIITGSSYQELISRMKQRLLDDSK